MVRTILACSVVALVAVSGGCRMCASPYDYSSPTFTGGYGPSHQDGGGCPSNTRSCSILDGEFGPAHGPELILPDSGELIWEADEVTWETDEVVMDSGEVVSAPEELVQSASEDAQPLSSFQPIRMSQGPARTWRAVQR